MPDPTHTQVVLNQHFPRLSEAELSAALQTCKAAGALNAAVALGRHITRLQIELDMAGGAGTAAEVPDGLFALHKESTQ
jgi:hypothetical protein